MLVGWSEEGGCRHAQPLGAALQETPKADEEHETLRSRTSGARVLPEGRSRVGSTAP